MATGLRRCRPQLHTVIWIVLVGLMLLSISPQVRSHVFLLLRFHRISQL